MAATNKLFIFIGIAPAFCQLLFARPERLYLLRHQTVIPAMTTNNGSKNWLVMIIHFC
jgi:hypothetical protein